MERAHSLRPFLLPAVQFLRQPRMAAMHYSFTAIADADIPHAANPIFQHLLDTYASETNKVVAVWRCFAPMDLNFRPYPKSSTVADILKHQLLSERRFFGEFVGTPEPPANEVLPSSLELGACITRMIELARPTAALLRWTNRKVVDGRRSVFRRAAPAHLGLLAARAAHLPSPHPAYGVSANAQQAGTFGVRPNVRPDLGRRRSDELRRSGGKKVILVLKGHSFSCAVRDLFLPFLTASGRGICFRRLSTDSKDASVPCFTAPSQTIPGPQSRHS